VVEIEFGEPANRSPAASQATELPPPRVPRRHGGYFENYDALGAKELALAIHVVEPELKPLVIVISDDPADTSNPSDDPGPDLAPRAPWPMPPNSSPR
jgi:hypothetical protein